LRRSKRPGAFLLTVNDHFDIIKTMSILKSNLPAIKTAIEKLFLDPELRRRVTYQKFLSETFNDALGHNVESFDDIQVTGVKFRHTAKSIRVSNTDIQVGDPVFLFRPKDLGVDTSLKDQIKDQDDTIFKVKEIIPVYGICLEVNVESGGLQS